MNQHPDPSEAEIASWFEGKEFTRDFVTHHLKVWLRVFPRFRVNTAEILEIGSFEGRSALFFLKYFCGSHITCVDFFHPQYNDKFDANLVGFEDRLTKIKGVGSTAMNEMLLNGRRFDFIYVDGGKRRDTALVHCILAWNLLKVGGLLIWDDYSWGRDKPPEERPGPAVDLFLEAFGGCFRQLHNRPQMVVSKTREWPEAKTALAAAQEKPPPRTIGNLIRFFRKGPMMRRQRDRHPPEAHRS
jgi:predicted O-methyltransferase YrrM